MPTPRARSPRQTEALDLDDATARRRRAFENFVTRHQNEIGNIKQWAERAGLSPNALYNFRNRQSAGLATRTLERLVAVVPGASLDEILGERKEDRPTTHLPINIPAARGEWRHALTTIPMSGPEAELAVPAGIQAHLGVRVEDDHAVHFDLPKGAFALVCDLTIQPHDVPDGTLVLVRRLRAVAPRIETTLARTPISAAGPSVPTAARRPDRTPQASRDGDRIDILGTVSWVAYAPTIQRHPRIGLRRAGGECTARRGIRQKQYENATRAD